MMPQNKPILTIEKFGYADSIRADRNRLPGMCSQLLNTAPNLSGLGERLRRGYLAYTAVTVPSGNQILQVVPIQTPSQEDVHIWFGTNGVYMNPYWHNGVKGTTNILLNETQSLGALTFTIPTAKTLKITTPSGMNATSDYYKNWVMYNSTKSHVVFITAWNGTDTFTFFETINGAGLNWASGDTLYIFRNFHDLAQSLGNTIGYNTTLVNPPNVRSDDSIIRFSGGQASSANNKGIWINPYLNKTFFPSASGPTITETYASMRECDWGTENSMRRILFNTDSKNAPDLSWVGGTTKGLDKDRTYWVAIAPVYDGFQIGKLIKYETTSDYVQGTAPQWTQNYLKTGVTSVNQVQVPFSIGLGSLNKRITGFALYAAQDVGDTHLTGRVSPYFFIKYFPIDSRNGTGANWVFTASTGKFTQTTTPGQEFRIDGLAWDARGNTYVTDSGIVETPTDIMYSYSDEAVIGQYHFLTNIYITSEAIANRQELFTNPVGGSAGVGNAGIIQPDIFSNELGFYRIRVQPTVGTKINGMRILGVEDLLILKDRGVVQGRIVITPENTVDFIWTIMSHDVGCATLKGHAFSDDGWVYFIGYDDIYRTRGAQIERLIESPVQNDWLFVFREQLTKTNKESSVCFYIPDRQLFFDIGQSGGKQLSYYPDYGWREVALNQSSGIAPTTFIKWVTRLQNGTVLVIDTSGNIFQWSNPTTGFFYTSDNTQAIKYRIDTGDFIPSQDEMFDTVLNYWAISKTFDSPLQGTLDIDLYSDGSLLRTYGSQSSADQVLRINSIISDARIANTWRLRINSNASPELLNAGSILTHNKIFLYGEFRPRGKRATEVSSGNVGTGLGDCVSNTISGTQEVTVNSTDTTFTWDIPFTKSYTGTEGAGIPTYRFEMEPAYIIGSDHSVAETVIIISKSLTQIVLRSTSNSTIVKFKATE